MQNRRENVGWREPCEGNSEKEEIGDIERKGGIAILRQN